MSDNNHMFSEANQCDKVPVVLVPVSDAHPAGLRWQRPCLCPKWTELENEIIRSARQGVDGQPVIVTEKVAVQGCLFKLLPWILGTQIRKANESLADIGKLRQEIEHVRQEAAKTLRRIETYQSRGLGSGQLLAEGQGQDQYWNGLPALFTLLEEGHEIGEEHGIARESTPGLILSHHEIAAHAESLSVSGTANGPCNRVESVESHVDYVGEAPGTECNLGSDRNTGK